MWFAVSMFAYVLVTLMLLPVDAVIVTNGNRMLAYFLSACPTGWTDSNVDPFRGRLIKGTTVGIGSTKETTPLTTQSGISHGTSHGAAWQLTASLPSLTASTTCAGTGSVQFMNAPNQVYTVSNTQGTVSTVDSGAPSVTMNLCEFTSATQQISLPPNIVAFFHNAISTCPVGWSAFSDANGRFLVFGSASVDLTTPRLSPAAAVTSSLGSIGSHSHGIPNFSWTVRNRCTTGACGGGTTGLRGTQTVTWTQTKALNSSAIPLPYVQLIACQVTDGTTNNVLPHPDAVFFYNGNGCPPLYRESTSRIDGPDPVNRPYSKIVGRLIWNKYSTELPGVAWGSTQFTHSTSLTPPPASDSGHVGHTHTIGVSGYSFTTGGKSGCVWNDCTSWGAGCSSTGFAGSSSYTWSIPTNDIDVVGLYPYRVMRGCSPQAPTSSPSQAPTNLPSKAPTTARPSRTPSKTPTIAPTTSFPTESPTVRPSRTPSKTPSRTPSKTPSRTPTTSTPTKSPTTPTTLTPTTNAPTSPPSPSAQPSKTPTTSSPSINPSLSPSTSVPSKSPTRAPAFESLCTGAGGDLDKFVTYENFFTAQASICAAQCRTSLLSGPTSNSAVQCVNNCNSFQGYSSNCMLCFQNYLSCQSTNCQTCFVASTTFLAKTCRDCATTKCRPALALCTGYSAEVMQVPTVAPSNPKDYVPPAVKEAISIAPIVGGVVGGFALMLAGAIFIQRRRMNQRIEGGLKQSMEDRLFGRNSLGVNEDRLISQNLASENPILSKSMNLDAGAEVRVPLRTRYSFHGDPQNDELDVPAGVALTGVGRNREWWIAVDESTKTVGLVPATFVSEL